MCALTTLNSMQAISLQSLKVWILSVIVLLPHKTSSFYKNLLLLTLPLWKLSPFLYSISFQVKCLTIKLGRDILASIAYSYKTKAQVRSLLLAYCLYSYRLTYKEKLYYCGINSNCRFLIQSTLIMHLITK